MLLRNQADPCCETAARRERLPITHLGDESDGDDRTTARNFLEPPALFTRPVPGMDALLEDSDLCCDSYVLPSKNFEAEPCGCGDKIVFRVRDDLQQLACAIAALGRNDAELGHMPADRIR